MAEKELLQLSGAVEEIIFRNDNNGYTVLNMLCDGVHTTAVGTMSEVHIGDELKLIGNWKNHVSYGEQFAFEYYEQSVPSTEESILKYLSSGAVKGIGRATAKRLVEAFGEHTLDVIQNEPHRLEQIKGISHDKAGNTQNLRYAGSHDLFAALSCIAAGIRPYMETLRR